MKTFAVPALAMFVLGALAVHPAAAQEDRERGDRRARAEQRERQPEGERQEGAARQRDQQRRTVRGQLTGEVVQKKRVDVRGTDRQHLVVLLKTDRGNRVPVDLGSPSRLGDRIPSVGDEITIRGRLVRIGERGVIVAEQLGVGEDRFVRIDQRPPRTDRNRQRRSAQRPETERERQQREEDAAQEQQAALGVALASDDQTEGVRVTGVLRGGPADEAGIEPGDVIVSADGTEVTTPEEAIQAVAQKQPGESLQVTIRREGERQQLTAELASREELTKGQRQRQEGSPRRSPR